jgi:YD repeat-containing protein
MYGNYQTQLFPGAAGYDYGLIMPPGTNDLEPQLSIFYNSQSAFQNPGRLGAGWSITSNYILRHVNYTVLNTADDYFVLYLNGYSDKLVLRSGVYKTDIETYLKVENKTSAGNIYWIVTSTDGTKYTFGTKAASLLQSNASNYTLKWFLDSIEDTHGNTINYTYLKNPFAGDVGAVYLSNITYNKDNLRRIKFRYETTNRPDGRLVYEQGSKFLEIRRLEGVDIFFNTSLVRRYDFKYADLNTEKTMSGLSNITYVGADNSSVLHRVFFEYYDAQPGFENSTKWIVPEEFTSLDSGSPDFGIRLVDVNNDGFMDIVKSNATANSTRLNDKNSTWNATTLFSVPEQIVDNLNRYQGVVFLDINRDGLVDLLKSKNGTRKAYLNNGTAWKNVSSTTWVIPVDFVNSTSGDEGVQFLELNGDGLVDLVQGKASGGIKTSWLNNGTGWINTSLWSLPDYFIGTSGNDTGLRELDLNGDGLTDLLRGGIPGAAWLNNGTGWVNESAYAPNLNFTSTNDPDLGVRFMDINEDNLVDIIQNFFSNISYLNQTCFDIYNSTQNCTLYNVTNYTNVKINNGTGWVLSATWNSPESFTHNGYNTGRRIADVNGDGYSDILVGFKNGTVEKRTWIRNATSSFILKKVRNEYGGTFSILYDKSTSSNNGRDLGFNIWVVGNVTANNSLTGIFNILGKTSYRYSGGKFDYSNSEFLGFANVNETLPDGSITSHFFHQDTALKGKEHTTIIHDKSNKKIKQILNRYTNTSDKKVYLNATSELNYEGNPTPVVSNITYGYDSFGNVLFINYTGNVAVTGDEKYERYNYFYNTTAYIVNKPKNYTLQNSTFAVLKALWFYYDNLANNVSKGDLTRTIQYNNKGSNPERNYTYDSYGNIIREVDALGNEMNYTFETVTNTYVIRKTNALGHRTNYDYDKGTGNLLFEEKDGISRNYTHDTFGRNTKEFIKPDTPTFPTKRISYNFDGTTPESIIVETKNNDTFYSASISFYDGLSNPVQIRMNFSSTTQIVQNYLYDNKSRIVEEQTPVFQVSSIQMNTSSNGFQTRYNYDALDRVTNITKKDGNVSKIIFNNTKVISINELGIQKEYVIDTYGRITNVIEHNRNSSGADELYNTSYYYDASDNLIRIVDALGNNFTFDYDSLGRKIRTDDPDTNPWAYAYDANGNLINQTDGRNVTVFLTYDKLNRLVFKWSNNTNVSFVYDLQYNGTLSNIAVNVPAFKPVYHSYTYDTRLRITKESLSVHIKPNQPGGREEINISTDYDSQDRIISLHLPNDTIFYEYNSIGKLKSVQGFLQSVNYNAFGKVVNKTYNNSLVARFEYDTLSRLNRIYTGNIQNLSYVHDATSSVKVINDTKNKMTYSNTYDDLDRLIKTIIYNYNTFEHEKYSFVYNKIGGIISSTTDSFGMNYSYSSFAHAPTAITIYNRSLANINLTLINPLSSKSVNLNSFFNFTIQTCCLDNDCWGIDVSLDPEKRVFTSNSETICSFGSCSQILYPYSKYVYENETWKPVEEAKSLRSVWIAAVSEDMDFPVQIVDYNYTTLIINFSVSEEKTNREIPIRIYSKLNNSEKPRDVQGNEIDKDRVLRFKQAGAYATISIDLSDTIENLLTQEIKWGDASTIIRVYDNNSINTDDSYIRSGSFSGNNYGSDFYLYIHNSTTSAKEVLVRFDTSQIPRQALIEWAGLYLYLDSNDLDVGEKYNVSVHSIYHSFIWDEDTIDWDTKPEMGTDYNGSYLDKININNTDSAKYLLWNVTSVIKEKNENESFYLKVLENDGGDPTDDMRFRSKEHSTFNPYLNITYKLKNLVSPIIGETPFYTTITNPHYIDLEQNQCQNVTWPVNATGDIGEYLFFGYANKTANGTITTETDLVFVYII